MIQDYKRKKEIEINNCRKIFFAIDIKIFYIKLGFDVEETDKLLNISFPNNFLSYLSINWVVKC